MATLKFQHVDKIYPNNVQAVFDFNLDVKDKEFIVFVGPSGCGKSTTLRMLAGLEDISAGDIYIDDKRVNDVAPKDRDIAMVFQNYALYPHMTIFDNMAFSLKLRKDRFPVYDYHTDTPEYKTKEKEIIEANKQETLAKIEEINNTDYKNAKKAKKDRIKELKFLQAKKLDIALKELKDSTRTIVYTYDHDKAVALDDELRELKKCPEENAAIIEELEKELAEVIANENCQVYEYRHYTTDEIETKILDAAEKLGLVPYLKRKPGAMSGGQRQRVALGRSIVRNPKVFLMDEPLSNLDAKLRVQMRSEISKIHKYVGATTIYVTHDQTEAMTMATRIVCMKDGYIQQIGTPKELFNTPENMFVAGFIGSPAMNFIKGTFDGKNFNVTDENIKIELKDNQIRLLKNYVNKQLFLGVRPEDVYFVNEKIANKSNPIELTCDISELLGRELIVYCPIAGNKFIIKTITRDDVASGDKETYIFDMDKVHFFDCETTKRIKSNENVTEPLNDVKKEEPVKVVAPVVEPKKEVKQEPTPVKPVEKKPVKNKKPVENKPAKKPIKKETKPAPKAKPVNKKESSQPVKKTVVKKSVPGKNGETTTITKTVTTVVTTTVKKPNKKTNTKKSK